nr:L,D-transpeptidase [Phreatobacter stygius]
MTAYAEPAGSAGRRGAMGGGFIEYLFNGGEAPPAPRGARAVPVSPVTPAPVGAVPSIEERVIPLQRRAARDPAALAMPDQPGVPRGMHPRFLPQTVAYQTSQRPGTIIIDTRERFLYLVEANGMARRYGVGVGRPGFGWTGNKTITRKAEWPDWRPPADMLRRRPDLPRFMAGGPANPLGARAMYLGSSLYRIHGSNEPHTIGTYVSSGCFRMRNEDVTDLYERVRVGTKVVVM